MGVDYLLGLQGRPKTWRLELPKLLSFERKYSGVLVSTVDMRGSIVRNRGLQYVLIKDMIPKVEAFIRTDFALLRVVLGVRRQIRGKVLEGIISLALFERVVTFQIMIELKVRTIL